MSISVFSPLPRVPDPVRMERVALIIGVVFYVAGSCAYIGLSISFFAFHVYNVSNESRIISIVLFGAMFYAIQGLIAILVARGGEAHRRHDEFLINQMRALYSHGVMPAEPLPPPSADT